MKRSVCGGPRKDRVTYVVRLKVELCDPFKLTHFSSWYIVKFMPLCCSCASQCQIRVEVIYPSTFLILPLGLSDTVPHQYSILRAIMRGSEQRFSLSPNLSIELWWTAELIQVLLYACRWKKVWFCEKAPRVAFDKFNRWKTQARHWRLDTNKEWLRPLS